MRKYKINQALLRKLRKLSKKDSSQYERILIKIEEIINSKNIDHYKNLKYDFKDSKGVHIGSFVLVFSYDAEKDFIVFEEYDHHDKIYL